MECKHDIDVVILLHLRIVKSCESCSLTADIGATSIRDTTLLRTCKRAASRAAYLTSNANVIYVSKPLLPEDLIHPATLHVDIEVPLAAPYEPFGGCGVPDPCLLLKLV